MIVILKIQATKGGTEVIMPRALIVLDPGHGQYNNKHTTKNGFYEGTQNFILANFLRDELINKNFDVLVTRKNVEDNPSLSERGELAGKSGAAMFLSLHSNAPGTSSTPDIYPTIRGVETYYSITDEEKNKEIAKLLNNAVAKTMNSPNRGIKTRRHPDDEKLDFYGVIRASATSGCKQAFLIEHGFHTNPEDSAFLQDNNCLALLAKAEANIISQVFGGAQ